MAEDRALSDFAQQMRADIIENSGGESAEGADDDLQTDHYKENVFTRIMSEYLADLGVIDDAKVCYYESKAGAGHAKVNGYYVDEESESVDLFASIYHHAEQVPTVSRTEVQQAAQQAARFLNQAVSGHHKQMEPASDQYSMVQGVFELKDRIGQVRVFVLTDGIATGDNHFTLEAHGRTFGVHVWDIQRVFRCVSSGLPYEVIEIDLENRYGKALPCLTMQTPANDYEAYLAIVPGEILYDLYDEYGSRLLELNVRSFLQARGKVNRGIRDTLKNEPMRFLAYNNGISATAEKLTFSDADGRTSAIKAIRGLQIVNGGQTMASIYHAKKTDKVDLSSVYVQAKITVIDPSRLGQIVPQISRYANSQNKVSDADFSANDAYHVALEHLADTTWVPGEQSRWFYERARGQYQVAKWRYATTLARKKRFEATTPASQKFTKTDLAKYLNSWDMLPHVVSRGAQKNFVVFMDQHRQTREKDWEPDQDYYRDLVAKAILFRRTERIVRQKEIPAFRANVVTYLVAYLCHRTLGRVNLRQIWDRQDLSDGLQEALTQWCMPVYERIVESAGERNVTEWCKKDACWDAIRGLALDVPRRLQDELVEGQPRPTVGQPGGTLTFQDTENITRVMRVPAATWLAIYGWGNRTGKIHYRLCGIAHTLSGYAAGGWAKVPSAKQARAAIAILEIAKEQSELNINLE